MNLFEHRTINFDYLRSHAFNYRWAAVDSDVIPLTAADPDFPVAEEIRAAIRSTADIGYFSYGSAHGEPRFKEAIANWYHKNYNAKVKAENILPVNSAAHGLFIVASSFLQQGDKAIIPDPVDFLFRKAVEAAGATAIALPLLKDSANFDLNAVEKELQDGAKAIFICNPNNPLGKQIPPTHLQELISLASKYNAWLVSDEIWSDIFYETPCTSILNQTLPAYDKKILVSGLSKNFGLAGLRIGYIICETETHYDIIFEKSAHATTAFGIATLSQIAGTAALTQAEDWLVEFRAHLTQMRKLVFNRIHSISFLDLPVAPEATYLAFPKIIPPHCTSDKLIQAILTNARVALVPGGKQWFEAHSEGSIRICFSTSEVIIQEAFDRIQKAEPKILDSIKNA